MLEIIWTPKAKSDFNKVLGYLNKNWSVREVEQFIGKTEKLISGIKVNPKMYIRSEIKKNVYKGLVTKHNSMFYRVKPRKKEILILSFWDNRQDPLKNKL